MSWKVCSRPGCATLVDKKHPCPEHGRPVSNWGQRNMAEHQRFARAAKKAQPWCSVCGSTDKLDAHHGPNGPEVLCNRCHTETDPHARLR